MKTNTTLLLAAVAAVLLAAPLRAAVEPAVQAKIDAELPKIKALAALPEVVAAVQRSRVPFQAISSGPNEKLRDFCRQTQTPHGTSPGEGLLEAIEQAYLHLLARFEIAYQPVSPVAVPLKVRLQTPTGWGETLIGAPAEPEAKP